jgi:gamma-glutamyltranspeptidase/glutathione hydrolase
MRRRGLAIAGLLVLASCSKPSPAPVKAISYRTHQSASERAISEAFGKHAMISTQGRASTQAALEILKRGGNVIDAAVAASFTISVERPHSTGLGGGGFFLYRDGKTGKTYAIDFRERAPSAARATMFLDEKGNVIPNASIDGMKSVAVPGFLPGMIEIHRRFGSLPLEVLLEPAIQLAQNGLEVYPDLENALIERRAVLARYPESRETFLHEDGSPYRLGEALVQKDLARTLKNIADPKTRAHTLHAIDRAIVAESRRDGGILRTEDFKKPSIKWREPLIANYLGYQLVSMPPPSSGGTHVIEALHILEKEPLDKLGNQSAASIHRIASTLQLVFADRAEYMGDPDFVKVPLAALLSDRYADQERSRIDPNRHIPSEQLRPGNVAGFESTSTTHFSIMDEQGDVVSSTQTINNHFGSGVTLPDFGIVLNDEMDDFSAKPGAGNLFGAVGGESNSIAPGKTPLSSMAPTLVLKDGKPVMAVGAPGGTTIISCVAETILNALQLGMPLYDAVNAIRYHHQWKPDVLRIDEPGPSPETIEQLKKMGYSLQLSPDEVHCRVMAVEREGDGFVGVSDPIDHGSSSGF